MSRKKKSENKPIKYEAPIGRPNRAYFPPGTRLVLADLTVPLIVTEGEKKALAADASGFPTIGLAGVWAWQPKQKKNAHGQPEGDRELLPDLAAILWTGRTVFVAFDSDWRTNDQVQYAMAELARILTGVGADVRIIDIPAADDGSKQGIDDFLMANGPDAFAGLIDTAAPPDEFAIENALPVRSLSDPHELADGYRASLAPDGSPDRLRFWQTGFWQYTGTHYQEVPDAEIKARLADWRGPSSTAGWPTWPPAGATRSRSTCRLDSSPTSGKPCPAGACCPRRSKCRRGSTGPTGRLRGISSP